MVGLFTERNKLIDYELGPVLHAACMIQVAPIRVNSTVRAAITFGDGEGSPYLHPLNSIKCVVHHFVV